MAANGDTVSRQQALETARKSEFCKIIEHQYSSIIGPVLITQFVIVLCAYGRVPGWMLAGWCAATIAVHAARLSIRRFVLPSARIELDAKVRTIVAMSLTSGIVHASSAAFLPYLPLYLQVTQYLLLLGLSAGCIAVNVGHFPTVLAFMGPIIVSLALFGSPKLAGVGGGLEASGIAALTIFYGLILLYLSRDTDKTFRTSVEIRLENEQLNRRLQRALQNAEAASKAKTRFLASASHDLRQPLHTLSFLTAALELRPLDDKGRDIVRNMARAVEDLSSEFDMLLDVSKLDAGVVPVNRSTFEIAELLDRVCQSLHALAEAKRLRLSCSAPTGVFVETDRMLLERIVRNLVDNAIKYTTAGGIRVTARIEGSGCTVAVEDTGIGIAESEREKVFEEFYQIDNPERDRSKGLGLGLPIVRRLAQLLEIPYKLRSAPGTGTTFELELPIALPPRREETTPAAVTPALRDRQFLIIDDEGDIRNAMLEYFQALGCQVSLAGSIDEAKALAYNQEPDLVVADFRLRGAETGLQAIEALRKTRPGLRALLITGDIAPERLAEMDAARIPMLHKPVKPKALVEKITGLLST